MILFRGFSALTVSDFWFPGDLDNSTVLVFLGFLHLLCSLLMMALWSLGATNNITLQRAYSLFANLFSFVVIFQSLITVPFCRLLDPFFDLVYVSIYCRFIFAFTKTLIFVSWATSVLSYTHLLQEGKPYEFPKIQTERNWILT